MISDEFFIFSLTVIQKYVYNIAELQHQNSLLTLQYTITSEKLKGLYISLSEIHKFIDYEKFTDEVNIKSYHLCKALAKYTENYEENIKKNVENIQNLLNELDILKDLKISIKKSYSELFKPLRNQISRQEEEIRNLQSENQKLFKKNEEMEVKILNFTLEIQKHRRNTKISLLFTNPDEKLCGKCQKVFLPVTNFNWSCRFHKEKMVNNM